jgi:ATP-dependent helicase/nuclease subunit B
MTTTVVTSVASRSRIDHARTWLEARDPAEEVLILGANLNAANELARSLAKTRGAAFGWHRLTLAQLAANIASPALTERGLASISQIGAEATVARLLHRLRIELRLGRFQPIAHTPGFPRAITAVLTELRLAQLSSQDLAIATPDVSLLLAAYEAELAELALADWPKILTLAADGVVTHRLSGLPLLMLDVPIAKEAELAFLRALATRAPEILATVPAADKPTLAKIRDDLHWQIEDLDLRSASVSDHALRRLQRNLFEESTAPAAGPATTVEIFSAPGEGRECIEIARRALALARERISFDRMAVLLRSPEEYRANLEEAFNRAGIPVHFARGTRRPDPAGRAFYALLKCATEGLSARRFAEYLSLGQVPDASAGGEPPAAVPRGDQWVEPDSEAMTEEESAEEPEWPQAEMISEVAPRGEQAPVREGQLRAPRRWEQLLVDAAVIGSHDRWRRRLEGLANELRVKLAELTDDDDVAAAAVMRTLDDLAAFTAYALPLIDLLHGWPRSANWGDWLGHLGDLATRALKRPDRVLAVLAELAPIAPVGPLSLSEVVEVVSPLLLERAVPPPLHRYGKAFVGPIEAARGLSFDAVFVPGLAERMFPRKIVEEPILLDRLREQISDDLATNQSRLETERLALALAVGAAESRICFSYPRLDFQAQPRPRVPSFYALEAWRATEGRLPDFTELARHAETATAPRLGWPGPSDPADAIDSAEHDLAILDRLAAAGRPDAGAARYLVTANPHLARALRARYQRWGKSWTGADGLVGRSELVRAAMARHTLGARS